MYNSSYTDDYDDPSMGFEQDYTHLSSQKGGIGLRTQSFSSGTNTTEEDGFLPNSQGSSQSPSGSTARPLAKKSKCKNPLAGTGTAIKKVLFPPHPLRPRSVQFHPINQHYGIDLSAKVEEIVQQYETIRPDWVSKVGHDEAFPPNVVKNTKYTWISFLPIFLYNEFRFFFNLYFLIVALTQFIPALQVGFMFTYVSPLCMVLGVSMCKEIYDDMKRMSRDSVANNELVSVYLPSQHDRFEPQNFSQYANGFKPLNSSHDKYDEDLSALPPAGNALMIELSSVGVESAKVRNSNDKSEDFPAFLEDPHDLATIKLPSRALQPGDIILLHPQQRVPCDCILLKAFDKSGTVFLKTDQLDGETDWKLRRPPSCTQNRMWSKYNSQAAQGAFIINAEAPKLDIYDFKGNIELTPGEQRYGDIDSMAAANGKVLEGLGLENTLWSNTTIASCHVLAMVIYTGKDSRSTLNANQPRTKTGALDMEVNFLSKILFLLTITLAFVMICMKGFYGLWYVYFFRYILLFSSIIPISLRVNLDMAKMLYAHQINSDPAIPDTVVRTSTIPEELGRISYIFSDKTGTLTTNTMAFKVLQLAPPLVYNTDTIESLKYHLAQCYANINGKQHTGMPQLKDRMKSPSLMTNEAVTPQPTTTTTAHYDNKGLLSYDLDSDINPQPLPSPTETTPTTTTTTTTTTASKKTQQAALPGAQPYAIGGLPSAEIQKHTRRMMEAVVLCHNVTPTAGAPQPPPPPPEEEANTGMLSGLGSKTSSLLTSFRKAKKEEDSEEKDLDDGEVSKYQASSPDEVALVSWADEMGLTLTYRDTASMTFTTPYGDEIKYTILAVFPFTSASKRMGIIVQDPEGTLLYYVKGAESIIIPKCIPNTWVTEEVSNLARIGLRTLVYAYKPLTQQEYNTFNERMIQAKAALVDRDENIQAAIESLEISLNCIGITGVEDKLQPDIRTTLETLRNAGIKIWMLTGDKNETAACIGLSTRLVERSQKIIELKCSNRHEAAIALDNASKYAQTSCLLVDGPSLQVLLDTFPIEFLEVACTSPSVICCRCSPTQKAQVVSQMKEYTGKRCLAIGDGGNDVAMIQAANVGVGIVGKEGQQAAMSADFSITQFSFLAYLLLWHGRNSYKRSASLAQFIMHRGMIISIIQAVFTALYFYVAVSIYTGWLMVGYTTVYTMLPVFSLVLDTDVDKQTAFMYPELYRALQAGKPLSTKSFFLWVLLSIYQGSMIMILGIVFFSENFIHIISITFTALIFCELLNVVASIKTWVKFMVYSLIGSTILYIISIFALTTYFDITFVLTFDFAFRVTAITFLVVVPPIIVQIIARVCKPGEHLKVANIH